LASESRTLLVVVLRLLGALDFLAILAIVMPQIWMASAHSGLRLGELPDTPIVGYLTRSASALYALHGAMILFISFDVERYARLITFLAVAALIHGVVMFGIDWAVGMPWVWTTVEGPGFAASGIVVLLAKRQSDL
jgi:hypothetical protein